MKHKMMKRICCFVMVMVLMASASITVSAKTYEDTYFYNREYNDAVNFVSDNGYMVGTTDTTFVPNGLMTRAMIVTVLYSMAGRPVCTNEVPFTDVKETDWFYDAVRWAYAKGMTTGNGAGLFSPHNYVTKQDAVLMLYKYAGACEMKETSKLFNYTDVENISSYALKAVAWALENDIFPTKTATSLGARDNLTRVEMALLVTKYGLNVEHIVYGRDDLGFYNDRQYFTYDHYYMTEEHYQKLLKNIDNMFINYPDWGRYFKKMITGKIQTAIPWKGSCYGIAVATILDKMGKIDFNGNFAENAKTMNDVTQIPGSESESVINYYFWAQSLLGFGGYLPEEPVDESVLGRIVERCEKEKGLKLFCYTGLNGNNKFSHAVVAYDFKQNTNGEYVIKAYDSRFSEDKEVDIIISKDLESCTIAGQKVLSLRMISDFTLFDAIDIDNDMNDLSTLHFADGTEQKDLTLLSVELTADFVIKNAANQELVYKDGVFSGDMEIIHSNLLSYGPDYPAEVILCVETSENYTYHSLSGAIDVSIAISNKNGYTSMQGKAVENVSIDSNNNIWSNDDKAECEIVCCAYEDEIEMQ